MTFMRHGLAAVAFAMLGGCVLPQDAALIAEVTGGQSFSVALPEDCELQTDPASGLQYCDFNLDERTLRIVLEQFTAELEGVAGRDTSAPQVQRQEIRALLETYLDSHFSVVYETSLTGSSLSFDASQAAAGGFDECLKYSRSLAYDAFVSDGEGIVCANNIKGTDVFVVHLAYLERRPSDSRKAASYDDEAKAIIRSLRRNPD